MELKKEAKIEWLLKNREKHRELNKKYYLKNKDKIKAKKKEWEKKNKEKLKKIRKRYYEKNKETILAKFRERWKKTKEKKNEERRNKGEQAKKSDNEKRQARREANIKHMCFESRMNYWRQQQKRFTLQKLESAYFRALEAKYQAHLPTYLLPHLL